MKTIAFYQPHLDIQGTGVSYFDYAYYNEKILGNKSIMICDKDDPRSHPHAIKKFKDSLHVVEIEPRERMDILENTLKELGADALYIQKCGKRDDGRFVSNIPTFIHCVGCVNDPHGTVYAYVSPWLAKEIGKEQHPYVPYMINLPKISPQDNLRHSLGIPPSAIVYGRTGGMYSWNIPWVNDAIKQSLDLNPNIWFLFLNTPQFIRHERVLYMEPFSDLNLKVKFMNTCDAMLHARNEGESFGASVAEFVKCNKPIITYEHSPEKNHLYMLGQYAIKYTNKETLVELLHHKVPKFDRLRDMWGWWNAYGELYEECSPKNVMNKFKSVFIDKL